MKKALTFSLLALFFAAAVVFSVPNLVLLKDETANALLLGTLARAGLVGFCIVLLFFAGLKKVLAFPRENIGKNLLWCLPCFFVAIVNFPFSALIAGTARVERLPLLPLFLLECLAVGLSEELLFRGLFHTMLKERLRDVPHGYIYAVLLSSALFGLWHLTNLIFGAGIGETLLQVGYTALLGAMFAVSFDKTGNLWLAALMHALFNVGGTLLSSLGSGDGQDVVFWILTGVFGAVCALHVLFTVFRADDLRK